jgi:hypothetical protein
VRSSLLYARFFLFLLSSPPSTRSDGAVRLAAVEQTLFNSNTDELGGNERSRGRNCSVYKLRETTRGMRESYKGGIGVLIDTEGLLLKEREENPPFLPIPRQTTTKLPPSLLTTRGDQGLQ